MLSWSEIVIRLFLASLLGALIGLERERKHWAAGLRTHMMVCVGSCLVMMVSAFGFSDILGTKDVTLDPSRIAAQVVSGIGFLGAGTILFSKQGTIRGLTTAAGLWTVAGIGLATGGGMYFAAGIATTIALLILWGLQPIERMYDKKFTQKTLRIVTNLQVDNTELFKGILSKEEFKIQILTCERNEDEFIFQLKGDNLNLLKIDSIINDLKQNANVKEIFWA
ncbi:MAG: MgtC/SapB family protein [Bacteroidetes bacterium]|nr:MgtC/SapB family protein [Bacteroidota bacterium]